MRVEIDHLYTPDLDPDTYVPEDPERFSFLVQLLAGPLGEAGEESFQFEVCAPAWLHDRVQREGPLTGRHRIIVTTFDWPALCAHIQALVTRCWGDTWPEVATKLARYALWEHER